MENEKVIAGRYKILSKIGTGGMANVYTAQDIRLNRTVAVKILNSVFINDDAFKTRFRREAQTIASINSPNIISIYDSGEEEINNKKIPYIVMEYAEGKTLEDEIKRQKSFLVQDAVSIIEKVLDGLEVAHNKGVIHRDIKPANIMLMLNGGVKIMDFGIARVLEEESVSITKTNTVVGTAKYISPEQAKGENVDNRSDLYSLGCIFYEMLSGRPPFIGDSAISIAYQHAKENFQNVSDINPKVPQLLSSIISKSLEKDPTQRFQTALEFKNAILSFEANPTATLDTVGDKTQVIRTTPMKTRKHDTVNIPTKDTPNNKKPKKKKIIIIVLIAFLLIGGLLFFLLKGKNSKMVTVPNCQNQPSAALQTELENIGLVPTVAYEQSATITDGMTTRCNPDTGSPAPYGSSIVFFVSSTTDQTVPDTRGMTVDQARQIIELAGLQVGEIKTISSTSIQKDRVVKTDPKSGESISVDTLITLYISNGLAKVPDFVGMSKDDAVKAIQKSNFVLGTITVQKSDKAENTVLSQDPKSGSAVAQGSTVNLVVSSEQKTYTMPNFKKKTKDYAQNWFNQRGIHVILSYESSPVIPIDLVISTDPPAGSSISQNDTVTIYVSTGS